MAIVEDDANAPAAAPNTATNPAAGQAPAAVQGEGAAAHHGPPVVDQRRPEDEARGDADHRRAPVLSTDFGPEGMPLSLTYLIEFPASQCPKLRMSYGLADNLP